MLRASQIRSSVLCWSAIDKLGSKLCELNLLRDQHHSLVDRVVGGTRQRNLFHPYSYFEDGWGDVDNTQYLAESWFQALQNHNTGQEVAVNARPWEPKPIAIDFNQVYSLGGGGVQVQECTFKTSAEDISHLLPEETLQARFLLVTPPPSSSSSSTTTTTTRVLGPTALLLAGKGEHSFSRRLAVAVPLAQRSGISSIILESPYYGRRRPRNQPGSKLRQVADLAKLGKTTIEEASSLIRYFLVDHGLASDVCVAGVSMGGLHSAMTASVFPRAVGAVSWLGPPSAIPVFTEGLLSKYCEWPKLQQQQRGGSEAATARMRQALHFSSIDNFPQPVDATRATFVVAKHDEFVPYLQSEAWWRNALKEKWRGCRVVPIAGGHVTGVIFGVETMRRCIEHSLGRRAEDPFA